MTWKYGENKSEKILNQMGNELEGLKAEMTNAIDIFHTTSNKLAGVITKHNEKLQNIALQKEALSTLESSHENQKSIAEKIKNKIDNIIL